MLLATLVVLKLFIHDKGIGITVILINVLMLSYYNTLQAYALYYLLTTFRWPLPWSGCDQPWSTDQCLRSNATGNESKVHLATSEFFRRKVLSSHLSTGFEDLGGIKWDLLACLFVIFSGIHFFLLYFFLFLAQNIFIIS
jgi:solute carrier family 6 serotonin transporter-like protein 4